MKRVTRSQHTKNKVRRSRRRNQLAPTSSLKRDKRSALRQGYKGGLAFSEMLHQELSEVAKTKDKATTRTWRARRATRPRLVQLYLVACKHSTFLCTVFCPADRSPARNSCARIFTIRFSIFESRVSNSMWVSS